MNATEPQIGKPPYPGSSERTAGLLRELSDVDTDAAAIQLALKSASETVDAGLCIYVAGEPAVSTSSEVSLVVPVHGRLCGNLVLARTDREFDDAEREQIQSVARALSLFQPGIGPELLDRLALQDELAVALRRNEIHAYFLPKVDLRTARIIGVEALARWFHPERGVLQPADFLGLAEAGGMMPR